MSTPIILGQIRVPAQVEIDILTEARNKGIMLGVEDQFEKVEVNVGFADMLVKGYVRLIDVSLLALPGRPQPKLVRFFRITKEGEAKLKELVEKKKIDTSLQGK